MTRRTTLATFDRDARKDKVRFVVETEETIRSFVIQGYRDLVQHAKSVSGFGSPVASGRFAASFRVAINSIDSSSAPADPSYVYPPGSGPRSLPPRTINNRPISGISAALRAFKLGDKVYVSNSVPYVRKIETGRHSWQTPDGVFEPTIRRLVRMFRASIGRFRNV